MKPEFVKNSILNKFSHEIIFLASQSKLTLFYSVDKSVVVAKSNKEHFYFDSDSGKFLGNRPNSEFQHELFTLISLTEILSYKQHVPLNFKKLKAV